MLKVNNVPGVKGISFKFKRKKGAVTTYALLHFEERDAEPLVAKSKCHENDMKIGLYDRNYGRMRALARVVDTNKFPERLHRVEIWNAYHSRKNV
jgi:hypothetical protein